MKNLKRKTSVLLHLKQEQWKGKMKTDSSYLLKDKIRKENPQQDHVKHIQRSVCILWIEANLGGDQSNWKFHDKRRRADDCWQKSEAGKECKNAAIMRAMMQIEL